MRASEPLTFNAERPKHGILFQGEADRLTAILRRLIKGEDEFDRLTAFGAVDGRLLARANGRDGFLEVGAMPGMPDGLNIFSVSVTGWAQVNGRSAPGWDEKFALDIWYVDHRTFWLDMKIVALTFFKVLSRSGAERAEGTKPLEEFRG